MAKNAVDEILQENLYKNISSKVDTNDIHKYDNLDMVKINTDLWDIEQLNIV